MAGLKFAADFSDYAPTRQTVEVYEDLARRIDEQLTRFRDVMDRDLAALNDQIRQLQAPAIAPIAKQENKEREPAAVGDE